MELKLDKTTKILLGAIALGLFLNASNVFIDKAYAITCADSYDLKNETVDIKDHISKQTSNILDELLVAERNIKMTVINMSELNLSKN